MKWMHKVSKEWMEARRGWLTASEIADLLPTTPTGRARYVYGKQLEVWAAKRANITDDMCMAFGSAARGHIMEPYAIDAFNKLHAMDGELHHWDDAIVFNEDLGIAFSPDAMSIRQCSNMVKVDQLDLGSADIQIGEVKSYAPGKHYSKGLADKTYLEERWQLATAMAVCDRIEEAFLILFNPNVEHKMFHHLYTRDDLEEEIAIVYQVADDYCNCTEEIEADAGSRACECSITESEIVSEIEAMQDNVNPI